MWWNKHLAKKPVRILYVGRVKTIADLKNLYVLEKFEAKHWPYTIKIRPHKTPDELLEDIEHLFVPPFKDRES